MGRGLMPLLPAVLAAVLAAANGCPSGNNNGDGVTDDVADTEDVEVDREAEGDGPDDLGPDSEADVDSDTDVRTDADADADGDVDDGDTEGGDDGWDADSLLPTGCRFVAPTSGIFNGWTGRNSVDAGKFVWRWIDSRSLPSQSVLMFRDLATGADREVLRRTYPEMLEKPAVHGDSVLFFSQTVDGLDSSKEIFLVGLTGGAEAPVTSNSVPDFYPIAGDDYVVYSSSPDPPPPGMAGEYRYVDLADMSEHVLAGSAGRTEITFDGHRWVAFVNENSLYKFDLLDPGAGPRQFVLYPVGITGMAFDRDTGVLIAGVNTGGESDDFRLEAWDMATDTMTVVVDEPWSQVMGDVDGRVIVYDDSQAAGETYWTHQHTELRIVDRDTGVKRVVMPLDTYYGVGIWERWIAFNNYGRYGDSLIICDLVAAGYMTADLHVIPE